MDLLSSSFNEHREEVRKHYGKNKNDIDRDVFILKGWIKQQSHLPRILLEDDVFLELFLLKNKFRIENTKQKLECYCTLRNNYIYLMELYTCIVPSKEASFLIPLPKLTPDLDRIVVAKIFNEDKFEFDRGIAIALLLLEVSYQCDYSVENSYIIDLENTTSNLLMKMNLNLFASTLNLYLKAYCGRIKNIYVINAPSCFHLLMNLLKPIISAKLFNRIKIYSIMETFRKEIGYDMLPSDYGGMGLSLQEHVASWDDVFKNNQSIFTDAIKRISNEKLRIKMDISFGTNGTFKNLNLD